jgi:hypothetical protein
MFTSDAAKVLQWPEIGSIVPGNFADLAIVDRDPVNIHTHLQRRAGSASPHGTPTCVTIRDMNVVKVGIVGAGNCTSAFVQGIALHDVADVQIVSAFDATLTKVGATSARHLGSAQQRPARGGRRRTARP